MWTCKNCKESHRDIFDECWCCGRHRYGNAHPLDISYEEDETTARDLIEGKQTGSSEGTSIPCRSDSPTINVAPIHIPAPFRQRLASYLKVEETEVLKSHHSESRMRFWIANITVQRLATRSAEQIRAILERIHRLVTLGKR